MPVKTTMSNGRHSAGEEPARTNGGPSQTLPAEAPLAQTRHDELLREVETLRRSEANLRDFVETATIGLHWVSGDGIILWANQAELDLLGYSREEYVGRHIGEFHADKPVIEDILACLIRGETLREYPARLRCKDGSIRHVLINSSVLFEDGKFVHTRCFTRDLTDRKQAEDQIHGLNKQLSTDLASMTRLQELSNRLIRTGDFSSLLYEILDAAIEITGADMGNIQLLEESSGTLKIFAQRGFDAPFLEFFNTVRDGLAACGSAMKQGKRVIVEDVAASSLFAGTRAGEIMLAAAAQAVQSTPLVGGEGQLLGMFSTHYRAPRRPAERHLLQLDLLARLAADSIERVQAVQKLREREKRYRELIEALPVAVYTTDAEGGITLYNEEAAKFAGRRAETGKDRWCVAHRLYRSDGTFLPHEECPMAITLRTGEPVRGVEAVAERPDGSRAHFIPYPTPVRDDSGAIVGGINVLVDITERKRVEEALRQSETRYRTMFEAAPVAVFVCDTSAVIQDYNHRAEEYWGRAPKRGDPDERYCGSFKLYLPDGRLLPHAASPIVEVLRTGIPTRNVEVLIERQDASRIPVLVNFFPLTNEQGEITGAITSFDDISDRKRAELAVLHRTAQFETLLGEAPLGVYLIDGDFRIREVNPTALPIFGNIAELLGRDFDEVMHILWPKAYADELVHRFRHTLETGEPYATPERIEERLDSGVREYYEWQISRIPLPEGRYGVVCYFRDISSQVFARAVIAESAERLRFMAESMPQKIFTAARDGAVDYFNGQWVEFTGLPFDEIKDWGWKQFIHPDDLEENVRLWKQSIDTGEPFEFVHRFRRADGVYRWHLSRAHAMRDAEGNISMWIGSNTDIHEEKQTEEELRRANEDLNLFAFAASHDLQEPLRMITSYSQLLVKEHRGAFNDDAEILVGYIGDGTKRMRELLSDLLAYTAVGAEQEEPTDLIDLNAVLGKVLENLKPAIGETGALINFEPLPRLRGAEVHFVQLFQNLIGNAIKYRGAQPATIRVSAGQINGEWRFEVSDKGIGIAPEYHEKVFAVFKRLHGNKIPGTGVGLAICKRVVERLGGRIWVESQPGQGATFCFTLPVVRGESR